MKTKSIDTLKQGMFYIVITYDICNVQQHLNKRCHVGRCHPDILIYSSSLLVYGWLLKFILKMYNKFPPTT